MKRQRLIPVDDDGNAGAATGTPAKGVIFEIILTTSGAMPTEPDTRAPSRVLDQQLTTLASRAKTTHS